MSRRFCTCDRAEGLGRLAMMVIGAFGLLLAAASGPALAETDSFHQDGVTLRLVMLEPSDTGAVRAALSVELEPGWKTYWIAPGPVGLAPRLDISRTTGLSGVTIDFPAPVRFSEGEAESVGYVERSPFRSAPRPEVVPPSCASMRFSASAASFASRFRRASRPRLPPAFRIALWSCVRKALRRRKTAPSPRRPPTGARAALRSFSNCRTTIGRCRRTPSSRPATAGPSTRPS